jgi:hypothetical protein
MLFENVLDLKSFDGGLIASLFQHLECESNTLQMIRKGTYSGLYAIALITDERIVPYPEI